MITPTPDFWKVFKETNGALSCTEAVAIMNIAAEAPQGVYVELGTYMGKSSLSASYCLKKGEFYLLEPEFEKSISMAEVSHTLSQPFNKNTCFVYCPNYSVSYLGGRGKDEIFSYVFVDSGSHQDGLPMQEVKLLEDRMVHGGIIAFHDFRSQFVEVEGAYNYLLSTGKYEEIIIDWQPIIEYVNANNLEEGNQSWHHNELKNPCFVGALKRK